MGSEKKSLEVHLSLDEKADEEWKMDAKRLVGLESCFDVVLLDSGEGERQDERCGWVQRRREAEGGGGLRRGRAQGDQETGIEETDSQMTCL